MKTVLSLILAGLTASGVHAAETTTFRCDFSEEFTPQEAAAACNIYNARAQIVSIENGAKAIRFGKAPDGVLTYLTWRLADPADAPRLFGSDTPFPLREGKLSFRFRPVDWELGAPSFNMLLAMRGPNRATLHLTYIRPSVTGIPSVQAAYGCPEGPVSGKSKVPALYPFAKLDPNREWHDVTFEWSRSILKLTVDGTEQILSAHTLELPETGFYAESLQIGSFASSVLQGLTDLADLKISTTESSMPAKNGAKAVGHPYLLVPQIDPPTLDGKIESAEYANALKTTGFVSLPGGKFAVRQSTAYIGYDDKNLYIALKSPGHNRLPQCNRTSRDGNLWEDDSVEFIVDATPETPDCHHFIFNYAGAVFDRHVVPDRSDSENISWNSRNVRTAFTFDAQTRNMEIVIPLENFGKPPRENETWRFNLCETNPGDGLFSLANVKNSYLENGQFGTLCFGGRTAPVFRLDSIGPLHRGEAAISAAATRLELDGRRYDDTAMTEFPVFGEVVNGIGGQTRFQASGDVLGKTGTLYLTAYHGDRMIYAGRYPYEALDTAEIMSFRRIPGLDDAPGMLRVTTSQALGADCKLRFALTEADGKTAVCTFPDVPVTLLRQDNLLPLKGITPGKYLLHMALLDGADKTVKTAEPRELTVYGKELPWKDCRLGITDQVPPPWIPLTLQKNASAITVNCWNRTYTFADGKFFPSELRSGQDNYLIAAPEFTVMPANRTATAGSWRQISASDRQVVLENSGSIGKELPLKIRAAIDYDGFIWFDIGITPGKPTVIDALRLTVDMPRGQATLLNSGHRDLTDTGLLPDSWAKKLDGQFGAFWLGHEKGGLSFGIESSEFWSNRDAGRQATVTRTDSAVRVTLNFIDKQSKVPGRFSYGFYIMPTPVRPRPQPFRKLRTNMYFAHTRDQTSGKGYPSNLSWWTASWHYQGYPSWATSPEEISKWEQYHRVSKQPWNNYDKLPDKNYRTAWYAAYSSIGRNAPETIWAGEEWRAGDRDKLYGDTLYGYEEDMIEVCKIDDYIDFYLWRFDKSRREDPKIDGIYFDLMQYPACARADHNHGYRSGSGRQPTYSIREHRKFLERIYSYCKLSANHAPVIMHMSGATARVAGFSFADYYLDGELWSDVLVRDRSYKAMKLDQMRAELLPHIYGPGIIWCSQLYRILPFVPAGERKTWKVEPWAERHIAGMLLLHDVVPDRTSQHDTAWKIWLALDRFGLEEDAEYLPYYDLQALGIPNNSDGRTTAVTGFRAGDGRIMLVCFNNNDAPFVFEFQGLAGHSARDLETGGKPDSADGILPLPVSARNFRLLELSAP